MKNLTPKECPKCGKDVSKFPAKEVRPIRFARWMQRLAILILPVMFFLVIMNRSGGSGAFGGFYLMAIIAGPSAFLGMMSLYFPKAYVVNCTKCGWKKEYTIPGSALTP